MDAFYASIEQRDNPNLKGKPIVVGGLPEGRGGVVATASYEARKFGIISAMPSKKAQQLCSDLIFIKPRFDVYKKVSEQIRSIFLRYTDLIEPLALDEAYLDVTIDKCGIGSAIEIARNIRECIKSELQLTASAGISINKFISKIASGIQKPDGLTFIDPSKIISFMESLPVGQFHGVGKVTELKMKSLGLKTGADIKKLSELEMVRLFGKPGRFYYKVVRGIDDRPVEPNKETKSISAEDTFPQDIYEPHQIELAIESISKTVHTRLIKNKLKGKCITVKIRFHDFKIITRSRSLNIYTDNMETIRQTALMLIKRIDLQNRMIRLLGISVSNFEIFNENENKPQLNLFNL